MTMQVKEYRKEWEEICQQTGKSRKSSAIKMLFFGREGHGDCLVSTRPTRRMKRVIEIARRVPAKNFTYWNLLFDSISHFKTKKARELLDQGEAWAFANTLSSR
jgi:hypothetical protein